jgi:hypothetical protein
VSALEHTLSICTSVCTLLSQDAQWLRLQSTTGSSSVTALHKRASNAATCQLSQISATADATSTAHAETAHYILTH